MTSSSNHKRRVYRLAWDGEPSMSGDTDRETMRKLVEDFKFAWLAADAAGMEGYRVEYALTAILPGYTEREIRQFLSGWRSRGPCPNCGKWLPEVDGDWFIRRRRAAQHRDHWKVCEA